MCGKRGEQLHLSHSSNLPALAHAQRVLSTWRDKEMIYGRSQRIVLFTFIVVFNKHTGIGCSNCESCVFTGEKGFPVWINVGFFCSFYRLQLLFLFCFSVWLPPAIYSCPKAVKWRVSKDVCATVAVWKMLLISIQRMDLFQFTVLFKFRKNPVWRIEVYFRLFTVTFPVTPFVWYVKVVGCELSREYVSLFPTTRKTTVRGSASHGRTKRKNCSM